MHMYCDRYSHSERLRRRPFHFAYAYVSRHVPACLLHRCANSFILHMHMYRDAVATGYLSPIYPFILHMHMYCDSKKLCKSHICAVFSLCNTSNTYACSVWRRTLCRQFIGANLLAFLCSLIIRTQP